MKRYIKRERNSGQTLKIILIGGAMMIGLDYANTKIQKNSSADNAAMVEIERGMDSFNLDDSEIKDYNTAQEVLAKMKLAESVKEAVFWHVTELEPSANGVSEEVIVKGPLSSGNAVPIEVTEPKEQKIASLPPQNWKENAVRLKAAPGAAKIVIIIDDMGMDRKRSHSVIDIDAPLTLAFLPYAPNLDAITEKASNHGHELLIHVPMEPLNPELNPGPVAILKDMSEGELDEALDAIFSSFSGYVGINNHMGSKVTQDEPVLNHVMEALGRRGLLFVDSKTIHNSLAGKIASEYGLDYAERDVFLDHESTPEFVVGALVKLEQVALRKGVAIAIGHPKDVTIEALRAWIPDAQSRGFTIVPVSAVVKHKAREPIPVPAAADST